MYRLSVAAIALTCISVFASAQDRMPQGFAEVLKDIPRQGGACIAQTETPMARTEKTSMPRRVALHRHCMVSTARIASEGHANWLVADVRSREEFDRMHVDGSLLLAPDVIRRKRYLAERPLLLIGSGKSDDLLWRACSELRQEGFKHVTVLRGGMPAWVAAGLPTVGQQPDIFELASLRADELYRWLTVPSNLIISALEGGEIPLPEKAKMHVRDVEQWATAAMRRIAALKKAKHERVIIVADERFRRSLFEALRKRMPEELVFFFAEPEENYRRYVRFHDAMLAKKEEGVSKRICGFL